MAMNKCSKQKNHQDLNFYASSISFWYRHQKEKSQYYMIKDKLSNEELVSEHIANNLYRLFGVKTPASYIVKSVNSHQQTIYSLASEYISGYSDLRVHLGGKDAISSIEDKETVKEKIICFNEIVKQKNLNFIGKAQLLLASICLDDYDVLGVDFSNIGAVKMPNNELKLVNIDPGQANITDNTSFEKNISLDNCLLKKELSSELLNKDTIMGNRHFLEFFDELSHSEIQKALTFYKQISDEDIMKIVFRDEYLKLVDSSLLETIAKTIIERKAILVSLLPELKEQPTKTS